jgi:hypothetical protein
MFVSVIFNTVLRTGLFSGLPEMDMPASALEIEILRLPEAEE